MECILQSLTSWSRLRAWRAGELNRICVVVDIGELCELGSQPISMGVHMGQTWAKKMVVESRVQIEILCRVNFNNTT